MRWREGAECGSNGALRRLAGGAAEGLIWGGEGGVAGAPRAWQAMLRSADSPLSAKEAAKDLSHG